MFKKMTKKQHGSRVRDDSAEEEALLLLQPPKIKIEPKVTLILLIKIGIRNY